jgi:gamma-glutamylcyclotransferase (GGCT)/AIG2-like uncharacterized protein YtfP
MKSQNDLPFFVYGTLLPTQPNAYLWGAAVDRMETAVFKNGRLYDLGNYPMMVEEPGYDVRGMVLTIQSDLVKQVTFRLDNLEGYNPQEPDSSAYQRVERRVQLADGRFIRAWVYIGQAKYVWGMPFVNENHWPTHAANQMQDLQKWWATIDSVAGLDQEMQNKPQQNPNSQFPTHPTNY